MCSSILLHQVGDKKSYTMMHGQTIIKTLGKVFQNLEKRIQVCLDVKGDQFQHLL